jgi:hypothetical protein
MPPCKACPSDLPVGGVAFDTDRQTLVLFGGYDHEWKPPGPPKVLNETWEWTVKAGWRQLHPATIPPARGMTAIVYDEARHVVLMFGGRDTAGGTVSCGEVGQALCSADTWTWNGNDWMQMHPDKSPDPWIPMMTYDQSSGWPLIYSSSAETWNWDGIAWSLKSPESGRPTPHRYDPTMAFDPATKHVVMYGGFSHGGGDLSGMWSWTGQKWVSLGTSAPFPRSGAAAAPDMESRTLVGYGNTTLGPSDSPAETWAWDGVRWTSLHPLHEPTASAHALFADPKGHQTLLVGTNFYRGNTIEIWAWNGHDWKQVG